MDCMIMLCSGNLLWANLQQVIYVLLIYLQLKVVLVGEGLTGEAGDYRSIIYCQKVYTEYIIN